jgi:hypothetical protein
MEDADLPSHGQRHSLLGAAHRFLPPGRRPRSRHYWAVQIVLFLLILLYCTAHELVRVIGKEKMLRLFFGPTPLPAF